MFPYYGVYTLIKRSHVQNLRKSSIGKQLNLNVPGRFWKTSLDLTYSINRDSKMGILVQDGTKIRMKEDHIIMQIR